MHILQRWRWLRHRRLSCDRCHGLHVRLRSHDHRRARILLLLWRRRWRHILLRVVWRLPPLLWVRMLCWVRIEGLVVIVRVCMRVHRRLWRWVLVGVIVLLSARLRMHGHGRSDVLARPCRHVVVVHHAGGGALRSAQAAAACLDRTRRPWSVQ